MTAKTLTKALHTVRVVERIGAHEVREARKAMKADWPQLNPRARAHYLFGWVLAILGNEPPDQHSDLYERCIVALLPHVSE